MNKLYELKCYGFTEIEDRVFFPDLYFNGIVELNKITGKIQNLYRFMEYGVRTSYLYSTVSRVGNCLVFVPNRSDKIATFDLFSLEISYVQLDNEKLGKEHPYFRSACEYNNFVYMFPSKASYIVKFDVKSGVVNYIQIEVNRISDDRVLFRQEYEIIRNKVYIPFAEKGSVCIFDLITDTFKIVDLGIKQGFSTINYVEGRIWMSLWEDFGIIEWNEESGTIREYRDFPEKIEKGKYTFSYSEIIGNQIIYFPQQCNMIISLDIMTGKISCVRVLDSWKDSTLMTFCGKKNAEGFYVVVSYEKDILSIMETKDGKICMKPYFEVNDDFNKSMIKKYIMAEGGYFFMEPYQNLQTFLNMVEHEENVYLEAGNHCGESIYKHLAE